MRKKELVKRLWAMSMAAALVATNGGMVAMAAASTELSADENVENKSAEEDGEGSDENKDNPVDDSKGVLATIVATEETGKAINFNDHDIELYCGTDWSGANLSEARKESKVEFNVSNFGWANSEWAIQYIIKNLGFQDNTTYTIEFDITSSVDKKIFLKLDDVAGFIAETVELKANETLHYSKTVECGIFSDKPYLFLALGQMAGEEVSRAGNITIENLVIDGELTEVPEEDKNTGAEYDFSKDNSEYDQADPGIVKDGYDLIWSDEFDGNYGDAYVDANTGLNLNNWAYQLGDGTTDCGNYGWGNNELQCYTDRIENIGVNEDLNGDGQAEGVLRITAKRDNDYRYANESAKNYTSARIRSTSATDALFTTTYGYIEARVALPGTAGAWPAFWMLPESTEIYGNWPVSGEIDILETCGGFEDGMHNKACGTLHWGTPAHVYKGSGYVNLQSDYTFFHTYAIDWQPGEITWYYDGQPINTLTNWESTISGSSDALSYDAPFDMPFYMLLNLAVDSGQFGGSANKASFYGDINMYVDYVRVFQKSGGYPDSVERSASDGSSDDWEKYAGVNNIAEITEGSLDGTGGGLSDADTDKNKWYLSYQNDATDATASEYVDENGRTWAKVSIASQGAQDYSVQLIGHYDAKKGYVYKVSYDAFAEGAIVGKTVNCDSKEWKGWSTYGIQQFKLAGEPSHYSYTFQQTEDFDNCRIEFNLGAQGAGNVYISNVKVEIVDPASIGSSEQARTPLADGNVIYNGSFDQGNGKFGYWGKLDGTVVEIPRYTTSALADSDKSVIDVASKSNYEGIEDGRKYYERRAQISAGENQSPVIYQPELDLNAGNYTVEFDLYSEKDTVVKVGAYTLSAIDDKVALGRTLGTATSTYSAEAGVRHYTLKFETKEDAKGAAFVIIFGKGAQVQLDNVYMMGDNQGSSVNEHPLDENATFRGDNGGGVEIPLEIGNGEVSMKNIISGGTWYTPQLATSDFELVAGHRYKLSFDYKLTGAGNGTFQYIIQENAGSWHVYANGPTTVSYDKESSELVDGFAHYELEFVADATISAVHLNFGFGNSGGVGDLAFTFKNAKIDIVKAGSGNGSGSNDNEAVDEGEFEIIDTGSGSGTVPTPTPGGDNGGTGNGNAGGNGGNSNAGNGSPAGNDANSNAGSGNNSNAGSGSLAGNGNGSAASGNTASSNGNALAAAGTNTTNPNVAGATRESDSDKKSSTNKNSGSSNKNNGTKNSGKNNATTASDQKNNDKVGSANAEKSSVEKEAESTTESTVEANDTAKDADTKDEAVNVDDQANAEMSDTTVNLDGAQTQAVLGASKEEDNSANPLVIVAVITGLAVLGAGGIGALRFMRK